MTLSISAELGNETPHPATNRHASYLSNRLNWLRAGVHGANDGIVSTAALVVGVAGATAATSVIFAAPLLVTYGIGQAVGTTI